MDYDLVKLQKETEDKFYSLGTKIASYDSLFGDVKKIYSMCSDLSNSLNDLAVSSGEKIGKVQNALSDHKDSHSKLHSAHQSQSEYIKGQALSQEQIKSSVSNAQSLLIENNKKLSDISNAISSIPSLRQDLEYQISSQKSSHRSLSDQIDSLKKELKDLRESIGAMNVSLKKIDEIESSVKKQKSQTDNSISSLNEKMSSLSSSFSSNLSSKVSELKSHIADSISSLVIPDPKKIPDISRVSKLESDMESVALDAKNSYLKSGNTELKLSSIEKKLEQVMLLAKRFELQQ